MPASATILANPSSEISIWKGTATKPAYMVPRYASDEERAVFRPDADPVALLTGAGQKRLPLTLRASPKFPV